MNFPTNLQTLIFFNRRQTQLMLNGWFGARWFGILAMPLSNNPFHKGIPGIQTTNPNHQLPISRQADKPSFSSKKKGRHSFLLQKPRHLIDLYLSNKRNPSCLGYLNMYIGDEIMTSYMGIMVNQYKDPKQPGFNGK